MRRTIAGFPAELVRVALETVGTGAVPRTLELWCVAELERIVDAEALLRAHDPVEPPYWALPWIGARAIAARLLDTPPAHGSSVLEIGCGLGLAGVAAGLGGATVLMTDAVGAAVEFARANAEQHQLARYDVARVDFTRDRLGRRFDLIVAADVVYEPQSYAPLVDFLDAHVARDGGVLLTESLRADAKAVLALLAARGFAIETRAVWVPEDDKTERTWLHALDRSRAASSG